MSELSEFSDEDVKYQKVESRLRTASPAPSMEDPDNVVRIKLKNVLSFQFSCDIFKSGVNTGWYLKELELLQANMTVQWLKQKLKVFATTAKYGMIELQSGNKQELQKIDLLINVFVQYWKNS